MTYNLNPTLNAAIFLSHMPQRELLWAANGYEYEKNRDVEGTRILCDGALEKFMQLSKLESWVCTLVVLS